MRVTGSMTTVLMTDSSAEAQLCPRIGNATIEELVAKKQDRRPRWRTSGPVQADLDDLVQRNGMPQQHRDIGRNALLHIGSIDVDAFQKRLHRDVVAHPRDIAGCGAVAERHHKARALPDMPDFLKVVLTADRAL